MVSASLGKASLQPELWESPVTQANRRKKSLCLPLSYIFLSYSRTRVLQGTRTFHKPVYKKEKPAGRPSQGFLARTGLEDGAGSINSLN